VLAPRVVYVSELGAVPLATLLARIGAVAALSAGARARLAVQLRDPELPSAALLAVGLRLREATRAVGARLVVNDRLDLARLLGADGVHLGRRSVSVADARSFLGAGAWISVACHAVDEVVAAGRAGADAAVLSPIFASPGKGPPLGLEALAAARARLDAAGLEAVALLALGGVDAERAGACFAAGADGVAAIRADLGRALQELGPRAE
jgi:thiamine-phosphate pyrophosphorylase